MDHLPKSSRVQENVARLCDVGGMEVVVVLDLLQVVVLQGHQETQQGRTRDLERSQQVSLLQDPAEKKGFMQLQNQKRLNYLKVVQVSTLESLIKLLAVKTSNPQELLSPPITSSNSTTESVWTP